MHISGFPGLEGYGSASPQAPARSPAPVSHNAVSRTAPGSRFESVARESTTTSLSLTYASENPHLKQ